MMSFRQYMVESQDFWDEDDMHVSHTTYTGGHRIRVTYAKGFAHSQSFGSVDFDVNGSYSKHDNKHISPLDGHHILHHVGKSLDTFIHTYKPTVFYFDGNTHKKHKLYYHAISRIATKHGGEVTHEDGRGVVRFKKQMPL
jgi:hypothetical protein